MTAQLDAQFGQCVPAVVYPAEQNYQPSTLFLLSASTAPRIRQFVTMSSDRHRFSCFPFAEFAILWAVNAEGEILIAIEEGVLTERNSLFPLPKTLAAKRVYSKLGHPTLVNRQPARIAGEIICDLGVNHAEWYINNRSGRYGVNVGRTAQQLHNVAVEFAKFGIELQPDFYR
jgi:hypothetical protein